MSYTVGNMYDHTYAIAHGPQDTRDRLDYTAEVDADATIYRGGICSLNSSGKFVAGCGAGTTTNYVIPMIATGSTEYPDTKQPTYSGFVGKLNALVVTAGMEIETTEYVSTSTYHIGDAVVPGATTNAAKIDISTEAVYANTKPILGFISMTPTAGKAYNVNAIRFWTCFFPAARA
ncbi:MAG: hypothetical protein WC910_08300 [Bacteroidales bacterium]